MLLSLFDVVCVHKHALIQFFKWLTFCSLFTCSSLNYGYKKKKIQPLWYKQVYRSVKFYYIVESRTVWPNLWRVVNLIHILLILAHWFGCFYFLLSEVEGFQVSVLFVTTVQLFLIVCLVSVILKVEWVKWVGSLLDYEAISH